MEDLAVYLVPLGAFVTIVLAVKVLPVVLRRRGAASGGYVLQQLERELGPGGRRRVEQLLRNGRKIQAIAVVRDRTGASLSDAKAVVEAMQEQSRRS